MAKFQFVASDGHTYEIEHENPDATEADLQQRLDDYQAQGGDQQDVNDRRVGVGEALGLGASQGLTLGFGDEIYGGVRGALDFVTGDGFNYAKHRDDARHAYDRALAQEPELAIGGELLGGLATLPLGGLGAAKMGLTATRLANGGKAARALGRAAAPLTATSRLAEGATMGQRVAAGAKEGASLGALYGLGSGRGDFSDQAWSTAGGAAMGGVAGAAMPYVVDAARGTKHVVQDAFRNPLARSQEKMTQAIARDAGVEATPAGYRKALADFDARASLPANQDSTMMAADLGGANLQGLVRSASDVPNSQLDEFGNAIYSRAARQNKRIIGNIAKNVSDPQEYHSSIDDIIARRKVKADKAFPAAMTHQINVTPELNRVLQTPRVKTLLKESEDLLALQDLPIGRETRMEALHGLKIYMDDIIDGLAKNAHSAAPAPSTPMELRAWTKAKRQLIDAIRPQNRTYIKALDEFAGESALKNAIESGRRDVKRLDPEDLAKALRDLPSDSERKMYRIGAARAMMDPIAKDAAHLDNSRNFTSLDMRKKLEALFPDKASARRFMEGMRREQRKVRTKNEAFGGSKTNKYQMFQQEADNPALVNAQNAIDTAQTAGNFLSGNWLQGSARLANRLGNRFKGLTPEVSAEILRAAGRRPGAERLSSTLDPAVDRMAHRANTQARGARNTEALLRRALAIGAGGQIEPPPEEEY